MTTSNVASPATQAGARQNAPRDPGPTPGDEPDASRRSEAQPPGDVDVVIPVYRGLRHVRGCLDEVARWSEDVDYRLIVVDDASDDHTHRVLVDLMAERWPERGTLLTNAENLGFLRTANRGMRAGTSPAVVVLNSDTLPTPGWLSGLLRCLRSADDVGIVGPTSNYANVTRIDVPYGVDHVRMAEAVRRVSPHDYPELGLVSGFCLAMRRTMLEQLDYFDEVFGRGYFEETDLCLRAHAAGWRVLADDATYVHHHGWGSFGADEYDELMVTNRRRFEERWGDADRKIARRIRDRKPFKELERRSWAALRGQAQVAPRRALPDHRSRRTAERARLGEVPIARHRPALTSGLRPLEQWPELVRRRSSPPRLGDDALILVDDLVVTPYTTDVLQQLDRLARLGLRVSLATSGSYDAALYSDPCRCRPYVLEGPDEAAATLPPHRLIIATSPPTVFDAVLLAARDGSRIATWFDSQSTPVRAGWPDEGWASVMASMLADAHLGDAVPEPLPHAAPRHVVPIGVDTDLYRPPVDASSRGATVLIPYDAAAGPTATADTQAAVELFRAANIEVTIYGHELPGLGVSRVPWSPQSLEQELLETHGCIVEIGPVPGLERLRLRAAACGTPLVLAGPVSRTCRLRPDTDAAIAPAGDTKRSVQLGLGALEAIEPWPSRTRSALARAQHLDSAGEARGLATAIETILAEDVTPQAVGPESGGAS